MGAYSNFWMIIDVICMAVSFFTFIKLLSSDVYLANHRLLPTIAGVITIFQFYQWILPHVPVEQGIAFLTMLSELCSMVIIFMMFFYFLNIKRPKAGRIITTITTVFMILLCAYDYYAFALGTSKVNQVDLAAVLFVFVGTVVVEIKAPSKRFFDSTDKIVGQYMMVAFVIAIVGYISDDYFSFYHRSRSIAFTADCIIFFWLALSNRIEDAATVLKTNLFDNMEHPIALLNADFFIIDANRKAIELFPSTSGISFAFEGGNAHTKFVLGENLVNNNRNDAEYFAGDRWYQVHYNPVIENKVLKGYIFSAIDVTEQRMEATDAKRETVKKSKFLALMSHELRSPLHAILGVSDILSSKKDISEKNKELIGHIKRASENLLELVNSILDYSKLEAGKLELAEREYDVNAALEDLSYFTLLNIQSKPIEFNLAVTTPYPKYLFGDVMRVREIFQNMLSNAVKFTENGSINVELAFIDEGERIRIDFSVVDTGQGMTPGQIEGIFKEYVSSADGETEGTGLGLAIVKQLVSKMGGTIKAESDGMRGAKFSGYIFQKIVGESELLPEHVFNKITLMNQSPALHGLPEKVDYIYPRANILVADDMRINLEIMQQLLAPWRCNVVTVPDGASAIKAVNDNKFDLILLDQMMAPISGPEACKQIREFSDVPIILVTANSEENARSIMAECQFTDFLGKPIMGAKLQAMIEKYLPKDLAEKNDSDNVLSAVRRSRQNNTVYQKTLEAFVKEMQPLLLNLPSYRQSDKEMFKVKVHGINGVSKQIGRETFAKQAQIMEMAAKSDTWSYVDEHMDEFLDALCTVVEDATKELTQFAPQIDEEEIEETQPAMDEKEILEKLIHGFDEYDLKEIEEGLEALSHIKKDSKLEALQVVLKTAYDNLEYEEGLRALEDFVKNNQ